MTELMVFDKQVCEPSEKHEQSKASEKLQDSSRQASDVKCSGDHLANFNVTRQTTDDGSSLTRFPNGVKSDRGGVAIGMEPPPGGTVGEDKAGNSVLYDANHKLVARLDRNDKSMHVFTKHGEFIESKDGSITYKPQDNVTDLSTLHRPGVIDKSRYEDYGMSSGGGLVRFPNGIEFDAKNNKVVISADHPNFREDVQKGAENQVTKRTGYDGDKVLYTWDKDGLHVPTADGMLTKMNDGSIKFEPTKSAQNSLPDVTIVGDDKPAKKNAKKETDPMEILEKCKDSLDPLCGLDLSGP